MQAFERAFGRGHLEAGLKLAEAQLDLEQIPAALDTYQRALHIAPDLAEAHYGQGIAALRLGRQGEAIQAFEQAFRRGHPEAGLKLAEAQLDLEQIPAALDTYQRALHIAPDLAEAHYGSGVAALRLGRQGEAIQAFEQAFGRGHPEAGLKLATAALANGSDAAALKLYERVLSINGDLPEAHYGIGVAALRLGRPAEAMNAFKRALTLRPDFAEAEAHAAFLALFPSAVGRRPRAARPLICIPILRHHRDWLGGQAYLVNLARILDSLPKSRRPRLVVAIGTAGWQEVASLREVVGQLLTCECVIGVVDDEWRLISSKPFAERLARREGPAPDGVPRLEKLRSAVDWVFPILYPMWAVTTVPGPIFWIPDLQHRFWPSFFTCAELEICDFAMSALAGCACPVVFSSRDSEGHFRHWLPERRCRTHIWHFASIPDRADNAGQITLPDLPDRFYFTPNQFWAHKDHATLFRALRLVLDARGNVTFVCTGSDLSRANDPVSRSLLKLSEELSLKHKLRLLGVLPRGAELEIMRRACAVIQPSLFEGWSTVVEDARALGRPLIVSDIPVHREQLGDSAIFFRPSDPQALAAAVLAANARLAAGPCPESERAAAADLATRTRLSAEQLLGILAQSAHPTE